MIEHTEKSIEELTEDDKYLKKHMKSNELRNITSRKREEVTDSLEGTKYKEISIRNRKIEALTKEINILQNEVNIIFDEISSYEEEVLTEFTKAELEFKTDLIEGDLVEDDEGKQGILVYKYGGFFGSWDWKRIKKNGTIADKVTHIKFYSNLKKIR